MRRVTGGRLGAVVLSVTTLVVCPAAAEESRHPGALGEMPIPGGLTAALEVIGDATPPDRGLFLLEAIRRFHGGSTAPSDDKGLAALIAHLDAQPAPATEAATAGARPDTLPLPLPRSVWADAVFRRAVPPHELLAGILRSREVSLLYYGLLWLDDETRSWLAREPELLAALASRHAGAFALAAPAIRVANGSVHVPGGPSAVSAWEALAGARVIEPEAFVRAVVSQGSGHLAYFYGAMAALTEQQVAYAFGLDREHAARRPDAPRRLFGVFGRISSGWRPRDRPFRRPVVDPAVLVADLRVDGAGRPMLPGTDDFWKALFKGHDRLRGAGRPLSTLDGSPPDFAWVCEHVFRTDFLGWGRGYPAVLFASRHAERLAGLDVADAFDAVRAAADYPALAVALERAAVDDPIVLARAVRRASRLSATRDDTRRTRSLVQFQGVMALVLRAAARGGIPASRVGPLIASLCDVPVSRRGDYEGALAQWVGTRLGDPSGDLDADLLRLVAGLRPRTAPTVEWEGIRYTVDLAQAEWHRLTGHIGDDPRPYVSSAWQVAALADTLERAPAVPAPSQAAARLAALADAVGLDDDGWTLDTRKRSHRVTNALATVSGDAGRRRAAAVARDLRLLADDMLGRGVLGLVYAVALGQPGRAWVTADRVARRHAFRSQAMYGRTPGPWELPVTSGSGVAGSLLGLDVAYAELALLRVSSKPPAGKPMVGATNRKRLVETVALVDATRLADDDRDAIAAALRSGRERLARVRTGADASALARTLRLSAARSSVLPWVATHDPGRLGAFLSRGSCFGSGSGRCRPTERCTPGVRLPARVWAACACGCQTVRRGRPTRDVRRPA
jgi:hypothetical protein